MPVDFSRLAVDHGMLSAVGPQATVVWDVLEEAEESTDETAAEGEVSGPGHLPACQGGSAVGAWGRGEEGHENSPATVGLSKKSYTMNGHGYKDSTQLLKYLDLEGDAYGSVVDGAPPDQSKVNALDVRINESAVQALRENRGPLQKLDRLRDEIANFKELFGRKKTMEAKIAAAGKRKIVHLDKTKLVQLDKKFYYEMHHEFDLYESLRLGRFVYNTPCKAERVARDQRAVEEREAEELRVAMEAAALRIQALNRGKRAREEALRLRQQQMAAQRDTRSSRGSSCRSSRVPSRPPSAPADPNTPLSPWDLFCMFCAGGDPQDAQGSKKAKTMDYKEWVNMLHYLAVFDKRVKKQKAAEIFKQANRGVAGDGDHNELDWDEFEFAFRKLAEHLGVHPMDVWCVAKPGLRAAQEEQILMTDGLTELFISFAAGDPVKAANTAQKGKRATTMDGKEFMALLTHLQLVPEGVSKTFALDIFAKAKAKGAGKDKSELDLQGFEWAMRRICRQVGADFAFLHIPVLPCTRIDSIPNLFAESDGL